MRGERIDPAGGRYVVYYDTDGDPVRHIDEINRETNSSFDGRHRVVSRTYPEGDLDQFVYDARDNVVRLTRKAKPGSTLADIVVSASWNTIWNKPDWIEDALGRRTTFTYYPAGLGASLLQEARQPTVAEGQPVWAFQYNANGLVTRESDPTGRASTHMYDARGNRTSSTVAVSAVGGPALNLVTTFTPDTWGDIIAVTDPRGNATTTQYDAMRRPIAEQRRNGGTTAVPLSRLERAYDGLGRVVLERGASALDASGNPTAWAETTTTYTPTGKAWRIVDPDGRVTTMTYDALDRPATIISAEGDVTAFAYDLAGQQLTETRGWTSKDQITYATYDYTLNGQRASVQDANANRTAYVYDGFDRLIRTNFPSPLDGQPNLTDYEALTYDPLGNVLTRRTRRDATLSSTYDALNRVSTALVPAHGSVPARTTTYGYDLVGRPLSVSDTNGHSLVNAYDAASRLITTQITGPQWAGSKALTYQYDTAGNRTRVTWPDNWYIQYGFDAANRMTTASQGGTYTLATFGWDPLSRPTQITYPGGSSMSAVYTAAGDQTSRAFAWSGGALNYANTFDFVHRLTSQTLSNPAFHWSPPGGTTIYAPDRLNRYASVDAVPHSYDANGNLTGDGSWAYMYDAENKLLSANSTAVAATYQYDPLGRRVGRVVNGVATAWISDGDDEIAEYDGTGTLLRRFVQGPMVDQPIAQIEASGQRQYLLQDRMGSIIGATNDTGALSAGPYAYTPYGQPNTSTGMPYRFTGRRFDEETGLYYYRARYYSPTLGRFLQTDPIGYADDLNMYGYVANDPVNYADPEGESRRRAARPGGASSTSSWVNNHQVRLTYQRARSIWPEVQLPPTLRSLNAPSSQADVQAVRGLERALRVVGPNSFLNGSSSARQADPSGASIQATLSGYRFQPTGTGLAQWFSPTPGRAARDAAFQNLTGRSPTGNGDTGRINLGRGMTANVTSYTDSSRGGDSMFITITQSVTPTGSRISRDQEVFRGKIRY